MLGRLLAWVDERVGLASLRELVERKTVPVHRYTVLYVLGGLALLFLAVQVVTGALLMLYYRPTPQEAFESVEVIVTSVPFGWLVRSLHAWSADVLVFVVLVHLASVFFVKAYRRPREMTWMTGCALFFLVLGFGFTGYLLPWNRHAFCATSVGTALLGAIPVVGEPLLRAMRGGDQVGGHTLTRFYAAHVFLLPLLTLVVLQFHLRLVQRHGMSVPPWVGGTPRRREIKFIPDFALRESLLWLVALAALLSLATLRPPGLEDKADLLAPAPPDVRPEWYFVFLFQALRLMPAGQLGGVELEVIPLLTLTLGALALVLVPFLDRGVERRGKSPAFTAAGCAAFAGLVGLTSLGYRSPVPAVVAGATAVVVLIVSRRGGLRAPKVSHEAVGSRQPHASAVRGVDLRGRRRRRGERMRHLPRRQRTDRRRPGAVGGGRALRGRRPRGSRALLS